MLNDAGKMVTTVWNEIPIYYKGIDIHEFVVMPNHIHGILQISPNANPVGAGPRACPSNLAKGQPQGVAPTLSLPDIIHRFKTMTTKCYADGVKNNGWPRFDK